MVGTGTTMLVGRVVTGMVAVGPTCEVELETLQWTVVLDGVVVVVFSDVVVLMMGVVELDEVVEVVVVRPGQSGTSGPHSVMVRVRVMVDVRVVVPSSVAATTAAATSARTLVKRILKERQVEFAKNGFVCFVPTEVGEECRKTCEDTKIYRQTANSEGIVESVRCRRDSDCNERK